MRPGEKLGLFLFRRRQNILDVSIDKMIVHCYPRHMKAIETWKMANGQTAELLGVWEQKRSATVTWTMNLERYWSKSGKSCSYLIYAHGGQSYPVGTFRTFKAAMAMMNSFSYYTKVVA